jgi:CRP-like cAMP-binding protein
MERSTQKLLDRFQDMHELFKSLTITVRAEIDQIAVTKRIPAGKEIARADEPIDGLYLIVDGALRFEAFSEGGERFLVGVHQDGDTAGLISAIDGGENQHFITAVEDTLVVFIPAPKFRHIVFSRPEISEQVVHFLCKRVRMAFLMLNRFGLGGRENRVAWCLVEMAKNAAVRQRGLRAVELNINQFDLSAMLAISRHSVNAELKDLVDRDFIAVKYGKIIVENLAGLEALFDG